jgi:Glutathionylspermidine synthase
MKLVSIPKNEYENYRLDVIFNGYKWDPQFSDNNTIAKHVLVITEKEHKELERLTEGLDKETRQAEEMLNANLNLAKPLALPKKIRKELKKMQNYQSDKHIRLARYDFHPIIEGGWAVSEVNRDVPGGFAESSLMPKIAAKLLNNENYWCKNFGDSLVEAFVQKVKAGGRIMLIHCTSYSDDRQVMQFLGDKLKDVGFNIVYAAADHLRFENNEAISILDGNTGKVDAIFRFTPLEWLIDIKPKYPQGYFDTVTPSCNHPIAIFTQTKRFPFVWETLEKLGMELKFWRELLPKTLEVKDGKNKDGFIFKPVYGRVGEKIAIKEACIDDEYEKIIMDVKRHPKKYLAQKRFNSQPLLSAEGEFFHVCLGSHSVEGGAAGYYARISKTPRIDSNAADIPVLIERNQDDR